MTTTPLECIEFDETSAAPAEPPRNGRRFAMLTAASAFVAGLATLLDAKPAAADCLGSPCCSLASCTWCNYQVNPDRYTCPSGYNRTVWTCVPPGGSVTWGCGECSAGSDCYTGPYACSVYYRW